MKLRELVIFNPTERLPSSGQVPFVDMAALPQMGRDIPAFIKREVASSGARFVNGDTLLARITPCLENGKGAQVRILPPNSVGQGSTEFIVMRAIRSSDKDFIYYLSRNQDFRNHAIQQMTGTSGRQRVAWQSLADYELPDIAPSERSIIGSILSALDDKIEFCRRLNQTLEAMVLAVFKDWFIDFGPTRAKMEGREPYLASDIWFSFPDRLDDDGLPQEWRQSRLGHFTELQNGYAFKSSDWQAAGVPVVKIGSVKPSVVDLAQASFVSREIAKERAAFQLKVGDLVIGLTGYVGETGRIPPTEQPPLLNQRVGRFSTNGNFSPFVYACVRQPDFKKYAEGKAHGSAQPNVSTRDLLDYPIAAPSTKVLTLFEEFVNPMIQKSLVNFGEISTLSEIRDFLIPRLMSGEVGITGAAGLIEEAL